MLANTKACVKGVFDLILIDSLEMLLSVNYDGCKRVRSLSALLSKDYRAFRAYQREHRNSNMGRARRALNRYKSLAAKNKAAAATTQHYCSLENFGQFVDLVRIASLRFRRFSIN